MTVPPSSLPSRSISDLDPQDPDFAIQAVDLLVPMAIARGASDLHLHPRADGWDVMLRVDGVLSEADSLPRGGASDPVTRLMVLAGLPTYRSGQPMEGRLNWKAGDTSDSQLSMRLGVYPTVHGPRAVVRLLRRDTTFDSIESLGLPDDVSESLKALSAQTDGAVFLSGPAGSGKTTTMYALLRRIASAVPRRSVMTIEDPVESVIDTISQSELDPSGGMTLASALRSAVRQDSEVLLVSEIRDPETAEAAMQASLTGHLIFSSLHASDVAASLRRLTQLGVPSYALRSGLRAVLSQRLLRRRCTVCGGQKADPQCDGCLGTGYRGRLAIAQCVRLDGSDPVGEALANSLDAGEPLTAMRDAARQAGGIDLHELARQLVQTGSTDQAEVYRVLGGQP